jgi:hypothetical protein
LTSDLTKNGDTFYFFSIKVFSCIYLYYHTQKQEDTK